MSTTLANQDIVQSRQQTEPQLESMLASAGDFHQIPSQVMNAPQVQSPPQEVTTDRMYNAAP